MLVPSGLLDDDGETDLGALEKKLAEKQAQSRQNSTSIGSGPTSPDQAASTKDGSHLTPHSVVESPDTNRETPKDKDERRRLSTSVVVEDEEDEEEQLQNLSEMMCSLVTNQSGETRYIGRSCNQRIEEACADQS